MNERTSLWSDSRGDAIVEATILFPIILMIFTGLCLLAIYLPTRANLQRATQYAATAMATSKSDSWLLYNSNTGMEYTWGNSEDDLGNNRNVYRAFLRSTFMSKGGDEKAVKKIVTEREKDGIHIAVGDLRVTYFVRNYVLYQEIQVTATRTIKVPVNLSFVGFPTEIPVSVTSSSVVVNGDEFVRNVDLAKDFTDYLAEKYDLQEMFKSFEKIKDRFSNFLGI